MSKLINFKAILNKKNKQINLSIPKKQLPQRLRELIKDDPRSIKKFLEMRVRGIK